MARTLCQAGARRQAAASGAHVALRLSAGDRRHGGAAQLPARVDGAHQGGDSPRHGGRRSGNQGGLPRHAWSGEPAVVHSRRGRRVRRVREPRIARARQRRAARVRARRPDRWQGAAAGGVLGLLVRQRPRGLSGQLVFDPGDLSQRWPDRYIHTNFDLPANVDPTKLRRAGFIAAASGWLLGQPRAARCAGDVGLLERQSLRRGRRYTRAPWRLAPGEVAVASRFALAYEQATVDSLDRFLGTAGATGSRRVISSACQHSRRPVGASVPAGEAGRSIAATLPSRDRRPSSATTISMLTRARNGLRLNSPPARRRPRCALCLRRAESGRRPANRARRSVTTCRGSTGRCRWQR